MYILLEVNENDIAIAIVSYFLSSLLSLLCLFLVLLSLFSLVPWQCRWELEPIHYKPLTCPLLPLVSYFPRSKYQRTFGYSHNSYLSHPSLTPLSPLSHPSLTPLSPLSHPSLTPLSPPSLTPLPTLSHYISSYLLCARESSEKQLKSV